MADRVTKERRSKIMSRIRGKDTKPEMVVRRRIHAMGYRYRLHRRDLPGTPDLVFAGRRKVVFVHGCFWHQHDDPGCRNAVLPSSNTEFWHPKLRRNAMRDKENQDRLEALGWEVLVIWECEVRRDSGLAERIVEFLEG